MKTLLSKNDVILEPVKGGIHAGGQHAQKNATGIRATHTASGTVVVIRGRSRQESIRKALIELNIRVRELIDKRYAAERKVRRDRAIHDHTVVRSYHFPRGEVRDHRTGKRAPLKAVLEKGQIELVAPNPADEGFIPETEVGNYSPEEVRRRGVLLDWN